MTAVRRDPARRYPSAQALANDLGHFLAGRPIRARPDELGYRVRKFVGRHRLPVAAVGTGIAALIAGLVLSLWQAHAASVAALRADAAAQRAERVKSFLISIFEQSDPEAGEGAKLTARELLERGAASIDSGLAGEPEVQADLLDAVARIENNLGLLEQGLVHARRALALRQAILPPSDGRIALSREALGEVLRSRGKMDEARQSFETALPALIRAYGAGSTEVAVARRALADTLHQPQESHRAVDLLRQALPTFVHRFGEAHQESAKTLYQLGEALEMDRQYREAEAAYRRAEVLLERSLGPRSLKVSEVQEGLAGLLDRMGRTAEARPLLERAIATQQAVLGPRAERLAETLFSYGILLGREEEYAAADKVISEALAIFGPDRFDAGHCLRYLGLSAMGQERYGEAAALLARAAETYRRTLGEDDVQRWRAVADLGWAHLRLGRLPEARAELGTALAGIERLGGANDYELIQPLQEQGELETSAGEAGAAVVTLRRAHALEEKLFGTVERSSVARTDLLLARALLARGEGGAGGDRREARRVLDEGLGVFARIHPRDALRGEALVESGRLALAESDQPRGSGHADTREARQLLATADGA